MLATVWKLKLVWEMLHMNFFGQTDLQRRSFEEAVRVAKYTNVE